MNNIYKNFIIVFLILLVLFIHFFSSDKTDFREPKVVNDESIGYYQSTTCNISFWEVVSKNTDNQKNLYFNSKTRFWMFY